MRKVGYSIADLKEVGFSAGELKKAGYSIGFSAGELKEAGYSAGDLKKAGFSAGDLKKAGFSAGDLKEAGFSAGDKKEAGYFASDLKKVGYSMAELKEAGYSMAELKEAGYSIDELKEAGYSIDELKEAGYSAGELEEAGHSAGEMKEAGFSANTLSTVAGYSIDDLKEVGYSTVELKEAGYSAGELKEVGYSASDLKEAGCSVDDLKEAGYFIIDLKEASYSIDNLKQAGYSAGELKEAGYSAGTLSTVAGYSVDNLKEAGYSAGDLKEVGFSAGDLKEAGYSAGNLKEAGFSAGTLLTVASYSIGELREAGYSARDLKEAGYAIGHLKNAGFSTDDLKEVGYSICDLKQAGYSIDDLKKAGYSIADLKVAGCSAGDLKEAGYSIHDLNKAGYSAGDLKEVGYSIGDLKVAGCSAGKLKEAGFSVKTLKEAGYSLNELKKAGFLPRALKEAGYSSNELKEMFRARFAEYQRHQREKGWTLPQLAKRKVFYRGTSSPKGEPTKRSFATEAGGTLITNFGVELLVPAGTNIVGEISVSLVCDDRKKGMAPPPSGVISVGPLIEVQPHAGRTSSSSMRFGQSFNKPVTMRLPHSSSSPHDCRVLHCENIGDPWFEIESSCCKPFDSSIEIRVNHFSFFTVIQAQEIPERVRCRAYRNKDVVFDGETKELKVQIWVVPESADKLHTHRARLANIGFEECGESETQTYTVQGVGFVALLDGARQCKSWQRQEAQVLFEMSVPYTPEEAGITLGWEAEIVRCWSEAVREYSPKRVSQVVVGIAAENEAYKVYAANFFKEGVAGDDFLNLTDEDLKDDYEIVKKMHRKKILGCIEDIKNDEKMKLPFAITIPNRPELLSPPPAPEVTSRTQTECSLEWDGVVGASHYQVEVAEFSSRLLVGGKLPASTPDNTFRISNKNCKENNICLHQAIFAGFVRVRAVDSTGIGPASIATPLPPKEYTQTKLRKARRKGINSAQKSALSEPNYNRRSNSQIDLLPSVEGDTTGSRTVMEQLDYLSCRGQRDAAAARTMQRECVCLADRLAALVLGLHRYAKGKEPELATVEKYAQRASTLIELHSHCGWLLLHITLVDHAHCFASVSDNLLNTVNNVEHWGQVSLVMRAVPCCYRHRKDIQQHDLHRQKLLELLLKALTTSKDVSEKAEEDELCRGFGIDRTELEEELEFLVDSDGVAALRHSCDEQQYSSNTLAADPSELGSNAELVSLLGSIQQGQQLIQQGQQLIQQEAAQHHTELQQGQQSIKQEGRQRHAELMGELCGLKRLHLDGLEGRDKCPSVFLLTHGNEPAPTFGFDDLEEAAAPLFDSTSEEAALLESLEMKRIELQERAAILVSELEVVAGSESSGTKKKKWRVRLLGRAKEPVEIPPSLEAHDVVAKLTQTIGLTTEYCEWVQGLVDVFQTLFNRAKKLYTEFRESNSANDSDMQKEKEIAGLLRLGCQIAQDCGHARKDVARWASFVLSIQMPTDTGRECAAHMRSAQKQVQQLTQTKVRVALLEAFEWGILNTDIAENSTQMLLAQFEVQNEGNDYQENEDEDESGQEEGVEQDKDEDRPDADEGEQQCDFMSNFKYNIFRSFTTKTQAIVGAKLNDKYTLYDTVKIHLLCECGSDGECHSLKDVPPYVVTIPSERVGKWGPLAGLALRTVGSAVGATWLPGTSAAKAACGAAKDYINCISDDKAKNLFEGNLDEKGRNELLGPALTDFHDYILELEPKHQEKKGWKKFQGLSATHVNGQICWLCAECVQQRRDAEEEAPKCVERKVQCKYILAYISIYRPLYTELEVAHEVALLLGLYIYR
jgi:biotin operon repressor